MRGEVILLVAGLAVAVALPVLEQVQVPSLPQSDLLKIILNANPEENDLKTTPDEKSSVVPTKMEEQVTSAEMVKQQPPPQPQDPPQSMSQDLPQKQPMSQDTLQEQPMAQDIPQEGPKSQEQPKSQESPQEQPKSQESPQDQPKSQESPQEQPKSQESPQELPQAQDTPQEQPRSQNPETVPEEASLPYVPEGEVPSEDLKLDIAVWPEPQPILVYPQDDEPEEPEGDESYSELGLQTYPGEFDEGYVVLQANEEPSSLDTEGTFMYGELMTSLSFDQEREPFLFDPEETQSEPLPYDSDEEPLSFEPQTDSLFLEPEEPQMKPLSDQSQEDSLPYDSGELVEPNPQINSFPLDEEPLESDYEQLSQMDEGPFKPDNYDYEFHMEEDQPDMEEDIPSSPENAPFEESYHESHGNPAVDLFSWLVPDFFDGESTDYDESPYVTSYHDDIRDEDSFTDNPEMQSESLVLDETDNWEEPSGSHGFDDSVHSHDSFLEDDRDITVLSETVQPHEVGSMEEAAGDVSLADFFIPIYDTPASTNIQQEYPDAPNPEDSSEELVSLDEENYFVDDGFYHVEPTLTPYQVDVEQDQPDMKMSGDDILFPENPSFEDEGYIFPWPAEGDEKDQTQYLEEDMPVTILESQPTYIADVETDTTYPSLKSRMLKGYGDNPVMPWDGAESFMVDLMSDSHAGDNEILHEDRDHPSNSLDNDAMDIIVVKDSTENFDFPIRPLVDDIITQEYPMPFVRYTEDQHSRPYWVPHRVSDQQFPKIYFSFTDKRLKRKIPTFFDRMDEDISLLPPPFHRSLKTPVMRNPFTFLNEVTDDDFPPQYLASPSTSSQLRFMGPDTLSSPRNYPDVFKTPKLSFLDLLQQLNPSFYDDMHINNMAKQSSPLYYPQPHNSLHHYNNIPRTLPPMPYSLHFDSFQEPEYPPVQNYYTNKPQPLPFHSSDNDLPSLFREDFMQEMYSRQPRRHFDDNTIDLPFMSSASISSPHPHLPFLQRPQYPANFPANKRPHYSPDSFYGMGPYHPTPIYPRYAPYYY